MPGNLRVTEISGMCVLVEWHTLYFIHFDSSRKFKYNGTLYSSSNTCRNVSMDIELYYDPINEKAGIKQYIKHKHNFVTTFYLYP